VLPTETAGVVGLGSVGAEEDLGGDDVVSSVLCVSESPKARVEVGSDARRRIGRRGFILNQSCERGVQRVRGDSKGTYPSRLLQYPAHLLLGLSSIVRLGGLSNQHDPWYLVSRRL
jgi:hypothetical protein